MDHGYGFSSIPMHVWIEQSAEPSALHGGGCCQGSGLASAAAGGHPVDLSSFLLYPWPPRADFPQPCAT